MSRSTRRSWPGLLLLAALALSSAATPLSAQTFPAGPTAPHATGVSEPHDTVDLYNALRDVINYGAELFNKQADHAGCYRVYQGALISVRPFLAPPVRKKIDDTIVRAEGLPYYSERTFELRRMLDEIRTKAAPHKGTPAAVAVAPGGTKVSNPKVELPRTDLPKIVETPKVNPPKVEIPKVDTPVIDITKPGLPAPQPKKVEAPKVELPKVDPPKVEAPKVELPKIEAPMIELPKFDNPKDQLPKFDNPKDQKIAAPKIELPKIDNPKDKKVAAPKIELPKIDNPKDKKVAAPKIELPKIDNAKVVVPPTPPVSPLPTLPPAAPKIELPKIDAPMIELPKIGTSKDKKIDTAKNDPPPLVPSPIVPAKDPLKFDPLPALPSPPAPKAQGEIVGKVLLDGKPLPAGFFVTLIAADGKKHTTVAKDGTFQLTKPVPVGSYRVVFEPVVPDNALLKALLPARYLNAATSGLTIQVVPGRQTPELRLTK